ncbi:13144_t:CDS:1 [Dentiscutata heterogama]|uniref:13144_t:CDS:1 n=1 Tax=Dentiscutata heterogama TaxID=1316150 RepID=A0ACA9KK96_9GLOM|nr:13144_t:CDS:1 [Dentiscutata heterogama]
MIKPVYLDWQKAIMLNRVVFFILATFFINEALLQGTTFKTPDVLTISYFKGGLENCVQQLKKIKEIPCNNIFRTNLNILNFAGIDKNDPCSNILCLALRISANLDPPETFLEMNTNGEYLNRWTKTQEYRTYIHIPSFSVSCDTSGHLVNYSPHNPDYFDKSNPTKKLDKIVDNTRNLYGYTKIPNDFQNLLVKIALFPTCKPTYELSDIYMMNPTINGMSWSTNSHNTCLHIDNNRSSHLSHYTRHVQQTFLHMDTPFIYTNLSINVCCNRQITVNVFHTTFPQTRLYINGIKVGEEEQTELGNFIRSGDQASLESALSSDGVGKLGPPGNKISWQSSSPPPQPSGNCNICNCNFLLNNCICSDSFSQYVSTVFEFGSCPACSCVSQSYDSMNNCEGPCLCSGPCPH